MSITDPFVVLLLMLGASQKLTVVSKLDYLTPECVGER